MRIWLTSTAIPTRRCGWLTPRGATDWWRGYASTHTTTTFLVHSSIHWSIHWSIGPLVYSLVHSPPHSYTSHSPHSSATAGVSKPTAGTVWVLTLTAAAAAVTCPSCLSHHLCLTATRVKNVLKNHTCTPPTGIEAVSVRVFTLAAAFTRLACFTQSSLKSSE